MHLYANSAQTCLTGIAQTCKNIEMTMYEKTLELIAESGKTPAQLAKETGLKPRWLYRLIAGDYEDPGVNKIEKLYKHLADKQQSEAA